MTNKNLNIIVGIVFAVVFIALLSITFVLSDPSPPSITYYSNSTKGTFNASRANDAKGTITVLDLDVLQQDYWWKAYVGNVSGRLTLDDASNFTIYDWVLAQSTGEVYISRNYTISWSTVNCSNQSVIYNEESALAMTSSAADSINSTFNDTNPASFLVGTRNMTTGTCRATATYVNDTKQAYGASAYFQESLLTDSSWRFLYTAIIRPDVSGYNNQTYDFQALVGENAGSTTPTPYYFFVELG